MHVSLQFWIACNIRAVAVLTKQNGLAVDAGFRVTCPHVRTWKPRAVIETDLLRNKAIERKRNKTKVIVQVPQRKNKSIRLDGPCAFGCPTTKHVDDSGACRWQRPPVLMKQFLMPE